MTTVLIVIHLMVVVAMIGLVLLQRSEGGALGMGGGGGGAFMTGRGAANVLTRSTGILAAAFFATSVTLALLARMEAGSGDIFDRLPIGASTPVAPVETPASVPVPAGDGSASDMLRQLGGSAGPQTPPTESDGGAMTAPAMEESAPAIEDSPPAMEDSAPAMEESAPATGDSGAMAPQPADGQ